MANKVALDVADIWSEGYKIRCTARDDPAAAPAMCSEWLSTTPDGSRNSARLLRFLTAIDNSRKLTDSSSSTYLFGDHVSYVDFLLLNVVLTMEFIYPPAAVAACLSKTNLTSVIDAIKDRPKIKSYLATAPPVLYPGVHHSELAL